MVFDNIEKILENSVILFLGSPLSGKGTQGNLLAKSFQCQYVSSGDLFRQEVSSGSVLGQQMKKYMDSGELIPNELTTTFLTNKLSDSIYNNGMILDGYPRNLSHLPIFEQILMNVDRHIFVAIYLNVPKSILDERRKQRNRNDDDENVFQRRYVVFQEETIPLIELFKLRNILIDIDCTSESPEEIHQKILSEISNFQEQKLNYLNSCEWLKMKLMTIDESNKINILNEFRRRALEENEKQGRRTGILRRIVYLRTENLQKYAEHVRIFEKLYGIEVIRVPSIIKNQSDESNIILLLSEKIPNIVNLALITERSNLYRPGTDKFSSLEHNVRAVNISKLNAIWIDNKTNEIIRSEFTYSIIGRIDLSRRYLTTKIDSNVFGWDDIFIVESNGMSYQELSESGIKISARDMVISAFIKEKIHYKELLNIKFDPPPKAKRAIDFSLDVADYISNNKTYNNSKVIEYGFRNLITHVLNTGIFFRSANNRRQANYWNPGLNGGLPLTAKADQIHQDTFMAHDIGHFAIPDLVFIGNNSIIHRRVYIAWRMISEATTMALADMLFIDALAKSNVEYDFNKRKIYPLFLNLNIDLTNPNTRIENLKQIIRANYKYCLCGDDSLYIKMLEQGENNPSLIEFKIKFGPFFVEDYRWTEHNYENMVMRSEEMARWWKDIEPLRTLKYAEPIQSIDHLIEQIQLKYPQSLYENNHEFIDTIFDVVFEDKIKPILDLQPPILEESSKRLFKSFTKWITAQLAITSKYYFLPESEKVRHDIISYISNLSNGQMTIDDVNYIRSLFEKYLQNLADKNFISIDDQITYVEVYPLFDPFYVNYDKGTENYEDLSTISKRIFSIEDYRKKQLNQLMRHIGRPLTTNESFYISTMFELIESGNGQINDGLFVTRPGVMILSESPINHRLGLVTFLLSGISIETSLEFIAHHESKVARLTSSKTNSMNIPLFRVQGNDTSQQRRFISQIIKTHSNFESTYQPRQKWGEHANEFFNMTYPSSKVTAICYTMNLEDLHKLFIGRMSQSGNEQEVIHVAQRMATLLHSKYPNIIQPIDYYLNCGNAAKYTTTTSESISHSKSVESIELIAKSKLTKEADRLFTRLNLCIGDDFQRLAEFRSRITYLAFPKTVSNDNNKNNYLDKIINQHGHLSVLDACQVIFQLSEKINKPDSNSPLSLFTFEQYEQNTLLFATLKQIRQAILRSTSNDIFHPLLTSIQKLIPL